MPQYNPPQKKTGPSVFLILAIIGFVAFVGLAALIGGGVYLVSKVRSDSDTLKTVQSSDRVCAVDVPSNWTDLPVGDRNMEATLQQANLFGERYLMVIADRKADIAQIFEVEEASGEEVLKEFTDLTLGAVEASFTVSRISNRTLSVNGLPAIQHKFKAKVEGIEVVFWTTYIEGKNHFYQVQVWTLASMEAQNEQKLLEITDSFKEN